MKQSPYFKTITSCSNLAFEIALLSLVDEIGSLITTELLISPYLKERFYQHLYEII